MRTRDVVRALTPPLVVSAIRRHRGERPRFEGRPGNWAEALRQSSGYSAEAILERVAEAAREVVAGRASYERDSVLFHEPSTPFPVVAAILRSAVQDAGHVRVIDVGGSLGSTYRQSRLFLSVLRQLEWHVVEQPAFARIGREEFSNHELQFHEAVGEVPHSTTPVTVVLSSVLQYLEAPDQLLRALAEIPSRHMLIDRTPLSQESTDRLCIQHVPKSIYDASYPCWIFSRERLMKELSPYWAVVSDFPSADGAYRTADGLGIEFRGMILERRT